MTTVYEVNYGSPNPNRSTLDVEVKESIVPKSNKILKSLQLTKALHVSVAAPGSLTFTLDTLSLAP